MSKTFEIGDESGEAWGVRQDRRKLSDRTPYLTTLNVFIQAFGVAKEAYGIPPAQFSHLVNRWCGSLSAPTHAYVC
jgi:hypothetical protein